ncbi:hypothetical protein Bca101_017568 [Brassica carinata]
MASSETEKSSNEKEPKKPSSSAAPPPSSQEPSSGVSAGMATPDLSGFQAYSPMPPHEFLASSPQPHPYMWGVQHMMPPYGTPPHPYVKMYPPGGMYANPSMPPGSYPNSPYAIPSPDGVIEASSNNNGGTEGDSKRSDVKEKFAIRRSERRLNMITRKNNEPGKNSGASANGAYSKRHVYSLTLCVVACLWTGKSAADGLSEGSDANSQNGEEVVVVIIMICFAILVGLGIWTRQEGWLVYDPFFFFFFSFHFYYVTHTVKASNSPEAASKNGGSASQNVPIVPKTAAGLPGGPPTYMNIRMGYWTAPTDGIDGKVSTAVPRVIAPVSRDGGHSQMDGLQDERELKRQRRKESNREAAQRSSLRKQAEFDKLAQYTEVLNAENASLRAEMNRLKSQREELTSENTYLKDQLLSFPPLEGINMDKDDQEPDTNQTGFIETKFVSYKDSTRIANIAYWWCRWDIYVGMDLLRGLLNKTGMVTKNLRLWGLSCVRMDVVHAVTFYFC